LTPDNIVLFQESTRVKKLEIPEGTEVATYIDGDPEDDDQGYYSVVEWVPHKTEDDPKQKQIDPFLSFFDQDVDEIHLDFREPTLEVDTERLVVHSITAAKFYSDVRTVERSRHERPGVNEDF
jgi:hypothetical protein